MILAEELKAVDVSLEYFDGVQPLTALSGVTVRVQAGEFVAIVGPSGCGKTSLIRVLAGLISPTSGSVLLGTRSVTHPTQDVGVIFQQNTIFPWFTVSGNVEFALRSQIGDRTVRKQRAHDILRSVGLGCRSFLTTIDQ